MSDTKVSSDSHSDAFHRIEVALSTALLSEMDRNNITIADLARETGIKEKTLKAQIDGVKSWYISDIAVCARAMGIPTRRILESTIVMDAVSDD